MDRKELHDRWLERQPDGATHDAGACPVCAAELNPNDGGVAREQPGGGSMSATTYTEDQVRAEVEKAVAELRTELEDLRKNAAESETAKVVEEAKAELQAQLDEVRKQLDEKVLEAKTATDELTAVKSWLDEEKAKAEQAETVAARRDERLGKVGEVVQFPDDYVKANAERWAAMDDEAFQTYLDDLKVVASKGTTETVPTATALTAARAGGAETTTGKVGSAISALRELRGSGVDPRKL